MESILYPYNDLKHFVLNLLMISEWGLQDGYSFNGPFWSVSVEVLLYALFFCCAPFLRSALWTGVLVILGVVFAAFISPVFGTGIVCYFMGGGAYLLFAFILRNALSAPLCASVSILALLGFSVLVRSSEFLGIPAVMSTLLLLVGVFPSLVLTLALGQLINDGLGRRYRIVGDITYATYMTHFPIQLFFILITTTAVIPIDFFSPIPLLGYLAAVILVSVPTYYFFELPAQKFIRRRYSSTE